MCSTKKKTTTTTSSSAPTKSTTPRSRSKSSTRTTTTTAKKTTATRTPSTSSKKTPPPAPATSTAKKSASKSPVPTGKKSVSSAAPVTNKKTTAKSDGSSAPPYQKDDEDASNKKKVAGQYTSGSDVPDDAVTNINFKMFPTLMEGGNLHDERDPAKWNLLLDPSGKADTFIRYRAANYFDVADPKMMLETDGETLRRMLVGAIRFQKCLAINVRDISSISSFLKDNTDKIDAELWDKMWDKQELRNPSYVEEKLFRPELDNPADGSGYRETVVFSEEGCKQFVLLIVAQKLEDVDPHFLNKCTIYRTNA